MERKKKKEEKEKEEKKRMKERRRKEKERVYLEFWVIFVFFRHLDSISITNQSLGPNNFLCVLQFTFCKSKKKKNEMWSYIWFTSQIETKKRKKEKFYRATSSSLALFWSHNTDSSINVSTLAKTLESRFLELVNQRWSSACSAVILLSLPIIKL